MKTEAQRIAIAEWCGWYRLPEPNSEFWAPKGWVYGRDVYGELRQLETLPDYLNDLNAMHEAEKRLKDKQIKKYVENLWLAMHLSPEAAIGTIHASASQRAEALLRTIGKSTNPTPHTKG